MIDILIYFLIAYIISLITVPLFTNLAVALNIVDLPDERKIHSGKIPRLGGLGIITGYLIVLFIVGEFSNKIIWYLTANFIIVLTGILDDSRNLTPKLKFLGQFLAATIIIFMSKISFNISYEPLRWLNGEVVSVVIAYLWIVGVTNAVNLIDGMDGLAGGISFIAFGTLSVIALQKGFELYSIMAVSLMGATLGFLRYNIPPAKVFMGDTGSLFLGFNIAVLSLLVSHKTGTVLSVLIPFLFISLPVFDTFLAIFRRLKKGKSPFSPDKEHLHHKLLEFNFSTTQALIIFYVISASLSLVTIFTIQKNVIYSIIFTFVILYVFLLMLKLFHLFDVGDKIRLLNILLRRVAKRISEDSKKKDVRVKILNGLIVLITILVFLIFITSKQFWSYKEFLISYLFLTSVLIILLYRGLYHIRNEFIAFVFFWVFFYVTYYLFIFNLNDSNFVVIRSLYIILLVVVLLKVILRKRIDLFISNPMEIMILFCGFLVYEIVDIDLKKFLFVFGLSFVMYYANKVYFTRDFRGFKSYVYIIVFFIFLFPLNFYKKLYNDIALNHYANEKNLVNSAYFPYYIKSAKYFRQNGDLLKARNILLRAYRLQPMWKFRDMLKAESAAVYSRLVVKYLFKGDLETSNKYFEEYLEMFPETVIDFYEILRPVFANLKNIKIKDAGTIFIGNNSIEKIVRTYVQSLMRVAKNMEIKGYKTKSEKCLKVAMLFEEIVKGKS
ncbi:glycosyltransferase family 4 protein [Deferribacter abyssi]|uniref:glycosyltransferase family 4 protein n=1 Tax=Deferribacter abyssi TaxID=213806 RepID=UPI003C1D7D7C